MDETPAIADLIRALAALRPRDDATRRAIARLLRIEVREPTLVVAEDVVRSQGSPPVPPKQPDAAPVRAPAASVHVEAGTSPLTPLPSVLEPDATEMRRPPAWLERVRPLPPPDPKRAAAVPPPTPLLRPEWTRAILSGFLSTLSDDGPLDVRLVVDTIARGLPLLDVPRLPWPTMARGVQVLVDRGDALRPFEADQAWLVERIRLVAGAQNVEVLSFFGCPSRGAGTGAPDEWTDYYEHHTPHSRASVLLLTDLGIGRVPLGTRTAGTAEWLAFIARVRRAGCPVVAFVPYRAARWPRALRGALPILHWDRATSARSVRRVVGQGLAPPGAGGR
jgi:hypothetical protein